MSGTHRDLFFCSKSRCCASKNHRCGRGPIETGYSDAKNVVVHSQNDRSCLVPIETCCSGPKGPVLHPKTTDEGCDT